MNNKSLIHSLVAFVALMLIVGCKPGVPSEIIQPDDMEDILYDYQLADAMAQQSSDYAYNQVLYREAVFKKYGITSAEFDSSMVYYTRHTESLHKIYENLAERLRNEALSLGASESEVNRYSSISSKGDTANVWNGSKSILLMPTAPYNVSSFDIVADSTYHVGDSFLLTFRCNYIFQEGMRDGVALLAVRYANDSVATRVTHMPSSNDYTIRIDNTINQGIKEVKGYFYLGPGSSDDAKTTLKLLSVYDIHLVRMRASTKPNGSENDMDKPAGSDSLNTQNGQLETTQVNTTSEPQKLPEQFKQNIDQPEAIKMNKPVRMLEPQKMNLQQR